MTHAAMYLDETAQIASLIDPMEVERMALVLQRLRERGGRLFLAGLGGGAANCSHAANDFRKLCGIEAYSLSDNASELTARANDEGFAGMYADMLGFSTDQDALLVFSVGGGADGVSQPIVGALRKAKEVGMPILGIVGRDGGATKSYGDCVVIVPTLDASRVTPHTEAFQMVVLHCLVSHPKLQKRPTKW